MTAHQFLSYVRSPGVEGLQGVDDLDATVDELRRAGVDFGGDMITGRGGRQAPALDPSGNLAELFEAYQR